MNPLRALRLQSRRISTLILLLAILGGILLPLLAPLFAGKASAAQSTFVETIVGGTMPPTGGDQGGVFNKTVCQGAVKPAALDVNTIESVLRLNPNSWDTIVATYATSPGSVSLFSELPLAENRAYTKYLIDNYNKRVNVLTWHQAPAPGFNQCGGPVEGGAPLFTMIPVASTGDDVKTWVVRQYTGKNNNRSDPTFFFKTGISSDGLSTIGNFNRFVATGTGSASQQMANDVVVSGVYKPTAPVSGGNVTKAVFADVATINVTMMQDGTPFKEVYVDPNWDQLNYYFLSSTESPARGNLTYSSQNLDIHADPRANPQANKTPFIFIPPQEGINFSHPSSWSNQQVINTMNGKISNFASGGGIFYNYSPDGLPIGKDASNPLLPAPQTLGAGVVDKFLANIWFYGSEANKAYVTAFARGDGNEQDYVGVYIYNDTSKVYELAAQDCAVLGYLKPGSPDLNRIVDIDWTVRKAGTNCQNDYGVLKAAAKIDEAKFTELSGIIGDIGAEPDPSPGELVCDLSVNPLTWLMCPIISTATFGIEQLDNAINTLLQIDVDRYFDQNCTSSDPQDCSGPGFYKAWNSVRILGTALVVIAALVMVIAQAAGLEFLDAYTIKKILPRMLVAVIFMNLSWELCKQLIEFSELLGLSVRNLIYSPFGGAGSIHIGGGTSSALSLVAGGTLFTLGIFATLSLVVSAFLACLVAFGVLVFRQVALIFLTILSAGFIAASILPNTTPAWKFGWESFSKMLLMFPIIVGFIAGGRVFAFVSYRADSDNLFFQLIAIIAYFAPYFLIPATFRLAGGAIATVGGFVNDRSRGVFDRLKNYRANTAKIRGQKMKEGTLYNGFQGNNLFSRASRGLASGFNRTTLGVGTGVTGRFGFGARGRAAVSQTRFGAADKLMKSDQFHKIKENDPALQAATYASATAAANGLRARGMSEATIRQAIADVNTSVGFGGVQQVAAAKALHDTGTGYANMQDWISTAARVSRGNRSTLADVVGYGNAVAKKNRMDLTPGFSDSMAVAEQTLRGGAGSVSQGTWDALTVKAVRNSGAPTTVVGQAKEAVFQNLAAASENLDRARADGDVGYLQAAEDVRMRDAEENNRTYTGDLAADINASTHELIRANYAAGSVGGAEHLYDILRARQAAGELSQADRDLLEQTGQSRVFGGGPPP